VLSRLRASVRIPCLPERNSLLLPEDEQPHCRGRASYTSSMSPDGVGGKPNKNIVSLLVSSLVDRRGGVFSEGARLLV